MPSSLGYGKNSIGAIPSCASLIFTLHLQRIIPNPYEDEKNAIQNFLAANDYDVDPTESGLYYIEHEAGTGDLIVFGDYVRFYYKGYFLDGRVFDSNYGETPFGFRVTSENIIAGWNEGVQLMKKGSKGTLIIPFDLAYGSESSNNISPFMTLVFDMEITDVD
jgi:FKBP-type peptidyl-prolyl cis-trans isomerase FkpA